jgi:Rad51
MNCSVKLLMLLFDFHMQILDSIIALFRVDFTGRGELAERQVMIVSSAVHKRTSVFRLFSRSISSLSLYVSAKAGSDVVTHHKDC